MKKKEFGISAEEMEEKNEIDLMEDINSKMKKKAEEFDISEIK